MPCRLNIHHGSCEVVDLAERRKPRIAFIESAMNGTELSSAWISSVGNRAETATHYGVERSLQFLQRVPSSKRIAVFLYQAPGDLMLAVRERSPGVRVIVHGGRAPTEKLVQDLLK